ncbi:LacI family DNA-binding transcriptional regulator [Piscinibacter gummiphilus]|uniref:LacI family transcriptional regulator n=1 Tax=Piscinibacter gummiphilus TaxID=946333 RepID=A0A1W6LAY5_9BURK|nr:LacI family DNA-binding transcriptional regulator [Piscinibacter gummiphilus]ARN21357.1 LacI family transcriptional regulator [Piscinibacter gummiphilus]ATU66043.1 LacI family transcriptional regulator [Piscinibacter gummiphilus]GLS96297.1 ribose operon repressor [Piscinibacter gummiphilus]
MSTIKDVAQHAQVSVATVSHVINDTRFVSEATRVRVQEAIEALRYVPSALARSLKSNRTHTVGMMIPNSSNPYFAEIIRGIEDTFYEAGFNVILCNSDDDPIKQGNYVRLLTEKQVDGLIVMSSGSDVELLDTLRAARMPQVVVDREIDDLAADLVEVNHEAGGFLATQHLLKLGHRRIGCIAGPLGLSSARERVQGYRRALGEGGVTVDDRLIRGADFTSAGGLAAMTSLLDSARRPTAVFASNDLMAIGAICAAAQRGLRIPQDVSVVGFDDIALAAHSNPPLTSVVQPKHQTGQLAAQLLLERIADPSRALQRTILQPSLLVRQSSGPVPEAAR